MIITARETIDRLPPNQAAVVVIDDEFEPERRGVSPTCADVASHNLAYVIYTSGSTGKPKGVMIEHRQAVNFFAGRDQRLDVHPAGTWLAVTSLSFDIHVLELLWTLTRGFKVVVYRDRERTALSEPASRERQRPEASRERERPEKLSGKKIDFSLCSFSADSEADSSNKYRLLLEGARYADVHGFTAVWTPERHFHSFGGLYPNPAVTGAAVAAITKHMQIRAGSVVLPLHHPARVAEAWQMVDNLSGGRVGISVAAGWQPNDFLLMPENFQDASPVDGGLVRSPVGGRRRTRGRQPVRPHRAAVGQTPTQAVQIPPQAARTLQKTRRVKSLCKFKCHSFLVLSSSLLIRKDS